MHDDGNKERWKKAMRRRDGGKGKVGSMRRILDEGREEQGGKVGA